MLEDTVRDILRKLESDPESKEALNMPIARAMIAVLTPKWGAAPAGTKCRKCQSEDVERSYIPCGGEFSGSVRCKACGHNESVVSYLGHTCFTVESLV